MGRPQADGDIVGQVVSTKSEHEGVTDVLVGEDGQIGGAAAQVQQRGPQFFFLSGQYRLAGGQGLQDDVTHVEP